MSIPREETVLQLVQTGTALVGRLTNGSTSEFNGFAVAQLNRRNVRAVLVECRSATSLDAHSEFVHVWATERATAILRARSIYRNQNGDIGQCRWKFRRSTTAAPVLPGCG